jgi:predicted RNA-binding Zn-ribbon protein involved in translation (DUF1610 family)
MEQDGCKVERCGRCGFSLEGDKVSEFRTCPFCNDWFIDRIEEGGNEVVCQGCGATAEVDVWNKRVPAPANL